MKRLYGTLLLAAFAAALFFLLNPATRRQGAGLPPAQGRANQTPGPKPPDSRAHGGPMLLPREELLKLLPEQIGDYKPEGEPSGSYVQLMGGRYSVAQRQYRKGNQRLKMAIADYNTAHGLYDAATATYTQPGEAESEVRNWETGIQGARAWEILDHADHKATVSVGLNERLLLTVEATPQEDTQEVRELVRELNNRNQLQESIR